MRIIWSEKLAKEQEAYRNRMRYEYLVSDEILIEAMYTAICDMSRILRANNLANDLPFAAEHFNKLAAQTDETSLNSLSDRMQGLRVKTEEIQKQLAEYEKQIKKLTQTSNRP
jgi:hypothetical protein